MGALTEVYVDPSINANSGAGTLASPYGDLQYALNTKVRDATNGDRFNIKEGAAEAIAAALSLATYGTPSINAPLVLQGYSATAGDGGIGDINGGGSFSIFNGSASFVIARNLKLRNVGARPIWKSTGSYCVVEGCELYDASTGGGAGIELSGTGNAAYNNYLHDIAGVGIAVSWAAFNTLKNGGTNKFSAAIESISGAGSALAFGNWIWVDSTSVGIKLDYGQSAIANSIFSNGGTGIGIAGRGSGRSWYDVVNNLIEGFSGSGGKAIEIASTNPIRVCGFNQMYACASYITTGDQKYVDLGTNTILVASPFTDGANFNLMPTAAVRAIAYPTVWRGLAISNYRDVGAAQHQDSGGGGSAPASFF